MKIELKSIKIAEFLSEETTAFTADIFVDGIKVGYAKNDGHGGSTGYNAYEGKRDLLHKAEQFCLGLPSKTYDIGGGRSPLVLEMNLEFIIDELVEAELKRKDAKKFEKKMVNRLMWGIPNTNRYTEVKFTKPLAQIPLLQLQVIVNKYKAQFKEGQVFLNTNLEGLGINI